MVFKHLSYPHFLWSLVLIHMASQFKSSSYPNSFEYPPLSLLSSCCQLPNWLLKERQRHPWITITGIFKMSQRMQEDARILPLAKDFSSSSSCFFFAKAHFNCRQLFYANRWLFFFSLFASWKLYANTCPHFFLLSCMSVFSSAAPPAKARAFVHCETSFTSWR